MKKAYFLLTTTPLHAGGSEQIDIIDLPIQRERHTRFPKIEGSSLKGALRAVFSKKNMDAVTPLFGGEGDSSKDKAASLGFSDARILAFPVKSVRGVFSWVSCPFVLERFRRDTGMFQGLKFVPNTVPSNSKVVIKTSNKRVILEEYAFNVTANDDTSKIASEISSLLFSEKSNYWKNKFAQDFVILDDDSFRGFVENSTEIVTRIKINPETKTVKDTGLFNEEFLPEDTVMYFLMFVNPPPTYKLSKDDVLAKFTNLRPNFFQLGADSSLGKGHLQLIPLEGE